VIAEQNWCSTANDAQFIGSASDPIQDIDPVFGPLLWGRLLRHESGFQPMHSMMDRIHPAGHCCDASLLQGGPVLRGQRCASFKTVHAGAPASMP
jgi:hypothetical protein